MAMNLDLTISGLCVIVFKSRDPRPAHPDAVEVLCVRDHHGIHRPRLSFRPQEMLASAGLNPSLLIDPQGRRFASVDIGNAVVTLNVGRNSRTQFSVQWGSPTATTPTAPAAEAWMNWVPSIGDVGLAGVQSRPAGGLPPGGNARLLLPFGDIEARNVIPDPQSPSQYLLWRFHPGKPNEFVRALANEVVFHGVDVEFVELRWGGNTLFAQLPGSRIEVGISNDLDRVLPDFPGPHPTLEHLTHLEDLADPPGTVEVPELLPFQQTGRPICNQVFVVEP